jgi:cell division protein FtsI/penicillin-binding protein 2
VTTLDAYLQGEVGRQLDILMERNQPALAEAIVVDVASGDVLAVDAREAYPFAAFAPIPPRYTPAPP